MTKRRPRQGGVADDKINVLLNIIQGLCFSQKGGYKETDYLRTPLGRTTMQGIEGKHEVHFARWREPQPGDLVLCMTGPIGTWKIAYYVQRQGYSDALLREIGSDRLCNMGNESFVPIVGLTESQMWDSDKRWFADWASKAFHAVESWQHRWRGITFDPDDEHQATIFFNQAFDGMYRHYTPVSIGVPITWSRTTTQREIREKLAAAGFDNRDTVFTVRLDYPLPHPFQQSDYDPGACGACGGSRRREDVVHDLTRPPAPAETTSTDARVIDQSWANRPGPVPASRT